MDNFERIADRYSLTVMKFMAVLHLALFFWFAQILVGATSAHAQEAASCRAVDMMPKLEAASPGAGERIAAAAARTLNGKGLLWKIEKDGVEPSWLYGTMHMSDPRVTKLSATAQAAYDNAATVVIETTDALDKTKFAALIMSEPGLTMYTGQETLKTALPPGQFAELEAGLKQRGVPMISIMKMKPWFLTTMMAVPACEMTRQAAGLEMLDAKLAKDAQAAGKEVVGLEKGIDQLRAMNAVPSEFHVQGLLGLLKIGDEMNDIFETMIRMYANGDVGKFKPLFTESEALAPGMTGGESYAEFEQIMVDKRNVVMADNSMPILAKGNAFIAVGALHLPGEKGLVEEFRRRGYTVTAN